MTRRVNSCLDPLERLGLSMLRALVHSVNVRYQPLIQHHKPFLGRRHARIRRPRRAIHNLRSIRAQEQDNLSDLFHVAENFATHVGVLQKQTVSTEDRRKKFEGIANLQCFLIRPMPSMLTPSVARVLPMLVDMLPAATTLQRMPLEP